MKRALIVGAASNVIQDVEDLRSITRLPEHRIFEVFAVNDGGIAYLGGIDHWVTLHPDELPEREGRRADLGGNKRYRIWGAGDVPQDYRIDGGTSALLAVGAARSLGYERCVLVGCPLSPGGYRVEHMHHGKGPWPYWRTYHETLPSLLVQYKWLSEVVRSMSGFTRETFGAPTREWLGLEEEKLC